jgi:c-di-GMP-binding flagellar brake protein YcgR
LAKSSVDERRAHERHATELTVRGTPDEGGVVARMVARNLSLGGLYCTSTTDFPEMTRLAVRLMLPVEEQGSGNGSEPIDVEAVVVRREENNRSGNGPRFDLALYFTNVDDAIRTQIQRYIDQEK